MRGPTGWSTGKGTPTLTAKQDVRECVHAHARTRTHAHAHSGKRKSIRSVLFISLWFLNTKDMRPINKKFPVKQLWEKRVRTPPQFHQRLVFSSLLLVISGEAQSEKR